MFNPFKPRQTVPVIHKPSGYEAYKDQTPIRRPQWRIILIFVMGLFGCGIITALIATFAIQRVWFNDPAPVVVDQPTPEMTAEITQDAFVMQISTALSTIAPTHTPAPTDTPEPTPTPTDNGLQATVDHVAGEVSRMQTQTAQPSATHTSTPAATPTPYYPVRAVAIYNNVIVRRGNTQNSPALTMIFNAEQFPVMEESPGWVRILHPAHDTAWVASHLVRIERDD